MSMRIYLRIAGIIPAALLELEEKPSPPPGGADEKLKAEDREPQAQKLVTKQGSEGGTSWNLGTGRKESRGRSPGASSVGPSTETS